MKKIPVISTKRAETIPVFLFLTHQQSIECIWQEIPAEKGSNYFVPLEKHEYHAKNTCGFMIKMLIERRKFLL